MSSFTEHKNIKRENTVEQVSGMAEPMGRRSESRTKAVFRPCCIVHDKRAQIGTIRNISSGGAQIKTSLILQPGDRISYFWDGVENTMAEVAWANDDIYGLRNVTMPDTMDGDYPRRSVRIPCVASAFAWIGFGMTELGLANISMSGMLVSGSKDLSTESLFSVQLGRINIPNCTIRWAVDGMVGIRFGRMLTIRELSAFLSQCEEIKKLSEQPRQAFALENFVQLSMSPDTERSVTRV